ncbi:MAG: PAS domain S-box protein [SAR324 cluster bacterium]|nr:PAS domain S-box protein [SAR324 cluster bacterium]
MKKHSDWKENHDDLRKKILGIGEQSVRKSYYPELQKKLTEIEAQNTELRQTKNFLDNIINSMPSILIGIDQIRKVTHWNQAAEHSTGLSTDQAIGKVLENVFPPLEEHMESIHQILQQGETLKLEHVTIHQKDEVYYWDITLYPLVFENTKGAVIRIDDITQHVRLEEMVVQAEKMMSLGGLAAGIAHEINNPLSIIMQSLQNFVRILSPEIEANLKAAQSMGIELDQIRAYMDKRKVLPLIEGSQQAAARASEIIKDMLQFSRRGESEKKLTDLIGLIEKTIALASTDHDLKHKYDFQNIHINWDVAHDFPQVPCAQSEIQQVFFNLLKNAAEAMDPIKKEAKESMIFLRASQEGKRIHIEVEDNGIGMEDNVRKCIFEPFFTTKQAMAGTGLGLSVSYFIITSNHQGTVTVESTPGKGTRFLIQLPL